jgi:Flp pilus assembly pilin Flp
LIYGIVGEPHAAAQWAQVKTMSQFNKCLRNWNRLLMQAQIWKDVHGQDLIEYALMAGFVAVSAGAVMPGIASSISTVFSKVSSVMKVASTQGS